MVGLEAVYIAVFGAAAIACFASAWRASRITDRGTKTGLVSLCLCGGLWATATVGRIAVVAVWAKLVFYTVGLVVGFASVAAWLYFCSAYAGYDYHYNRRLRWGAGAGFAVIAGLKLTNPLHHLYFTYTIRGSPFPHLTITLSPLHWVVTGLAYSLSMVGFYLLYELFRESQFQTTRLAALVSLTAAPAVFDIIAFAGLAPRLVLPFNYEPVGVALFAVGVLYVVDETFVAIPRRWRTEFVEQFDNPIMLLTRDGVIRDLNRSAAELAPAVNGAIGRPLEAVAPHLQAGVENPDEVVELQGADAPRFYAVQLLPLARETGVVGEVVVFEDVTDIERQRRELRRQNDQLNEFSVALNHELRNAVTVLQGFIDQSADATSQTRAFGGTDVRRANSAVDRIQRVVGDLTTLARYGQTPEATSDCELRATVADAWAAEPFDGLAYSVATDATVVANTPRLEELFRTAFQFASANGATTVTVDVEDAALTITGDGETLSAAAAEEALKFGPTGPRGGAEMSLPNIRLLARVQGWTTDIDTSYDDGVRLRIGGVSVQRDDPAPESSDR